MQLHLSVGGQDLISSAPRDKFGWKLHVTRLAILRATKAPTQSELLRSNFQPFMANQISFVDFFNHSRDVAAYSGLV